MRLDFGMAARTSFVAFLFLAHFALPARAGLVALYNFDGGSNGQGLPTSVVDSGPNGLNGTAYGALTYTTNVASNAAAGTSALDATGDYNFVKVADSSFMHTGEFTVEALVNPRYDLPYDGGVVGHDFVNKLNTQAGGNYLSGYQLGYDPNSKAFYSSVGFSGDNGVLIGSSGQSYDSNHWYDVAETYKHDIGTGNGILTLYVDGAVVATQTFAYQNPFYGTDALYIGAGNFSGDNGTYRRNFNGYIDAVRITDNALSANELFSASQVPEPASIVSSILGVACVYAGMACKRRRSGVS